ncbi:hypothetical protein [Streptomyces sp. NPDC060194]|uniref:hypothetical protein n=1 Tax=Streptomyces sp. NPDC060194 TaxID=3347069 RepID=UPI0036628B0C
MGWDEWDRLKADAAGRAGGGGAAGDRGAAGGGPGDLRVGHRDLARVGDAALKLFEGLSRDGGHARPGSEAAAKALSADNYALGAALAHVAERWEGQTKSLRDACAHISRHLDFSGRVYRDTESVVAGRLSSIATLDQGFDEGTAR